MDGFIRVAVVEDNPMDRETLKQYLHRYERERGVFVDAVAFSDGEDLVTDYAADFDLILMDIEMAFMNGMETARRVRALDAEVPIVFVTNAPQYAIEGYKVRAMDYILKPLAWPSFSESLDRVFLSRREKARQYLTIALRDGRIRLEADDICYVEVQDHQLIYNTRGGRYVTKSTIREAEAQLSLPQFFRCNRCYIVNLKHVEAYKGYDVKVNGDVIQVSRRQRKSFLDALNAYMNGDDR